MEQSVKMLSKECEETLSSKVRLAIVTSMLPGPLQEFVYTHVDDAPKNMEYEHLVDKLRTVVGNKVAAMSRPTPMDIGEVGWNGGGDLMWDKGVEMCENWELEDEAVNLVGADSQCYRCGGWGHLARDCATMKGKGKGGGVKGLSKGGGGKGVGGKSGNKGGGWKGDGKGKGGGKGWEKGSWGGKAGGVGKGGGFGKGYQGTCWRCGVVGHKAAECGMKGAYAVDGDEEGDVDEVDIGGMWMVGSVDAKSVRRPRNEVT